MNCNDNPPLTSIDVSGATSLTTLHSDNNNGYFTLDLSANSAMYHISLENNTNLQLLNLANGNTSGIFILDTTFTTNTQNNLVIKVDASFYTSTSGGTNLPANWSVQTGTTFIT